MRISRWGAEVCTGKTFLFCIFQDILLLGGACKGEYMIRHWGFDSQLWFHGKTVIILVGALWHVLRLLRLHCWKYLTVFRFHSTMSPCLQAKSFKQLQFATCHPLSYFRGRNVLLSEAWNLLSALSACKWAGVYIRSCYEPEDCIQPKHKSRTQKAATQTREGAVFWWKVWITK